MNYTLVVHPGLLAICRLPADAAIPEWANGGGLWAAVRTEDELSVVCKDAVVPPDVTAERRWRALKVQGTLNFSLVGVLASLADVLAKAGISIFVISTYDTDYLLIKEEKLADAFNALQGAGHGVILGDTGPSSIE
jgi:hypothetical protein